MVDYTRTIENENGSIAPAQSLYENDELFNTLDRNWIQNAFMIPDTAFSDPDDVANRYYSSANLKFTDTRLGCSIGINPRPQFCHYSDVPVKGRITPRSEPSITDFSGDYGMGRQYSEFVDDAAQRIYMSFGVPQFNSLLQFFSAAYESNQMTLARTGRATSIFYIAGNIVGAGALLYAFPLVSVGIFVGKVASFFFSRPKSKFYSMKPTMHWYWSAVNQLVQAMCINRGILPRFLASENEQRIGKAYYLDPEYLEGLSEMMPDIFRDGKLGAKYFDVYGAVSKAQRIANKILVQEYNELNNGTVDAQAYTNYVKRTMTGTGSHSTPLTNEDGSLKASAIVDHNTNTSVLLENFFNLISKIDSYLPGNQAMEVDPRSDTDEKGQVKESGKAQAEKEGLSQYIDAQVRDGSLFATFIVDYTGPQSESWTNSVAQSELAQKLNGVVSNMSEARFSLGDGNLIGGIPSAIVGAAATAVTDTAAGVLSGITGGLSNVIAGMSGGGYIDVPKHWTDSAFQATRANYSIQLVSPYGNPISQLMNLDIPIAMLMAGALPRSTGKASYTSPFLCQVFDRGRCQIRLGMIENLSFTRGTTHLGFNDNGAAMSVDVQFSVVDLSSIMHIPISSGVFGGIDMTMDDDNILQDYLAVLAGMSIESQIYDIPKIKLKVAKSIMNLSRLTGPGYWASLFSTSPVYSFMQMFSRQSSVLDYSGNRL